MKTQRNEPCPCGSGLKYKKCCGNNSQSGKTSLSDIKITPRNKRNCENCSACCDGWVRTQVLNHTIDLNQPCPYSTGHNCRIHKTRPVDPCQIFFCGWVEENSRLPNWMRPSQCGVIVLTGRSAWRGKAVDVLVSCGKKSNQKVLNWFMQQSKKELRPFIYQADDEWFAYGPKEFQVEMEEKSHNGEALWT